MKPHLPKLLLVALLALQAYSPAFGTDSVTSLSSESDSVVLNDLTPEGSAVSGSYTIRGKNITLNGDWTPQYNDTHYVHWVGADGTSAYEMTGSGTVSIWLFQISSESEDAATYTIGKDIIFDQVDLAFDTNDASVLNMNGTLKNSTVGVWKGKVNVSDATLSGNSFFQISKGATLVARNFVVKENVALRNSDGYPVSGSAGYATLEGNLVMNGTLPSITTETQTEYDFGGWAPALLSSGYVQFGMDNDEFAPLNVTGSITINSATAVVFSASDAYITPEAEDSVFICSSVSQPTLNLLKPYANRQMHDEQVEYTKPLDDREFYARAGDDGRVHIYLDVAGQGDGDEAPATTGTVTLNDLVLGEDGYYQVSGKHIQLNGDWMPAYENEYSENYVEWNGEDATQKYTFTGNGTMGDGEEIVCFSILGSGQFSIGEHVKITDAEIYVGVSSGDNPALSVEGTLHNVEFSELHQTIDLQKASLSGYQKYGMEPGGVIQRENLYISGINSGIELYITGNTSNVNPRIDGNLILDGQGSPFGTTEKSWNNEQDEVMGPSRDFNAFLLYHDEAYAESAPRYLTLEVTGSLTIQSETAVVFRAGGGYKVPDKDNILIICGSVEESELARLSPYALWSEMLQSDSEDYSFTLLDHTKPLDDYEFYARAGDDGKVHIYLGEAQPESGGDDIVTPPVPEAPVETITINTSTPDTEDYGYAEYVWQNCNLKLDGSWVPVVPEDDEEGGVSLSWRGDGKYTMSGSGTIGSDEVWTEAFIDGKGTFTIGSDITFDNAEICVGLYDEDEPTLVMNGKLVDCEVFVGNGTVDLTNTKFGGTLNIVDLAAGTTLRAANFSVTPNTTLAIEPSWSGSSATKLEGNLVINSNTAGYPANGGEYKFNWYDAPVLGTITFYAGDGGNYGRLDITGNLVVKSQSIVLFESVNADYDESTGAYKTEYVVPAKDHVFFTCAGVTKDTLNLLAPVVTKNIDTEIYDEETDELLGGEDLYYYKHLADRQFYAKVGADGQVEIRLGTTSDVSDPSIPNAPSGGGSVQPEEPSKPVVPPSAIVVGSGNTVQLGKDEATTPSTGKPVFIQGGIADASGLDASLLNNKVIQGTGGSLVTGAEQSMDITGSGSLGYSVVGADADTPGADLKFRITGELSLEGKNYDTAKADISGGVLTVDPGTRLGMGADKTEVAVQSGASLTNFGTVAGDIDLAGNSTMLNQGKVEGDIVLQSKSTMVNNSTVTGDITVNSGALLSGSGSADSLLLKSGAALNVGNSPGWQKYKSVTIERGSQLTFTVDGTTAATATNHGAGTHSVLETETLTIGDGADTVKVTVNVTMGIVTAGAAPFDVELMEAGTTNATAGDFTITLNDNSLLEEGAEVSWDAATKSLTLSGTVNKAALAALMDSNAANVANTMWASANAVQEFARTAESQFLVGMPGQTTFWGGALGSFMDTSGDAGFTSNLGGYAVGLQHAFTESFRAGFAFGQSFGSFKSDDDQLKADQTALMPALTAQYVTPLSKESSLSISGHIAYGTVENEADTYQAATTGKAEWDDKVLNIGVRASWNSQIGDNETVSIFTGLTYQNVEQDSFTEEFTGGERDYRSGSMSCLSLPIGATWRGIYQMEGTNVFVPEVTVAYIGDIVRDNPEVKTSVMGISREGKGTNIGRSAFMLNAGANWMFDSTWSMGAFYTLEARSHQVNQSVNASLRYSF